MNMSKSYYAIFLVLFNISITAFPIEGALSSKPFVTGEDGVIRMSVNVIGHVKNPGTFMVYDGIDILTLLSLAGGYLEGADLNKIIIKHSDGSREKINLNKLIFGDLNNNSDIIIKPRDTVYIRQKTFSKIITSSNLPSIFLSILNIALTIERTN